MTVRQYRLKIIGSALKRGDMWISGKVSGGHRWPDEPHYWVIQDPREQEVYHVPCSDRPTWERYVRSD